MFFVLSIFTISAYSLEVTKTEWTKSMSTALPTYFCQPNQYFRQCFNVSAEVCEETALSATRVCIRNNFDKIPEIIIQPKDGRQWGNVIGTCAGKAYGTVLIKQFKNTEKCKNVNNWK